MEKNNVKEFEFISEFAKNSERYYFKEGFDFYGYEKPKRPLKIEDFCFIKVCSVTYNEKFPRKEALENVIGAMRLYGVNFNYIIKGDKEKVSFYYGISRNLFRADSWVEELNIKNICDNVLKRSLEGNFRGGEMKLLTEVENRDLFNSLRSFKNVAAMEGVPGLNEDDSQQFQRVDRLADVMLGDEFMFLVNSMFIAPEEINKIETAIFSFYNKMSPYSKISEQDKQYWESVIDAENEYVRGFIDFSEGKAIWKKQGKETKYALRLIPLGGFVNMLGEAERSEEKGSFSKASIPKRKYNLKLKN